MDEIVVVPYDPAWPARFEAEAALLHALLPPSLCLRVAHFGSTAVPGLAAKPIVDILLGVESLDEAVADAVPLLESVGYSFWRDNPTNRVCFWSKACRRPRRSGHTTCTSRLWTVFSGSGCAFAIIFAPIPTKSRSIAP